MTLRFNQLLRDVGIQPAEVRLLRHQDRAKEGKTPYTLWKANRPAFEAYQSAQDPNQRARFSVNYWASFVVPDDGRTLFAGLYRVHLAETVPADELDPLHGQPFGNKKKWTHYDRYLCEEVMSLTRYAGRLSIDWGVSAHAWVQMAERQDKEIIELLQTIKEEKFPGYTSFIGHLSELEAMPGSWMTALRVVRGVYLLVCPTSNEWYVGMAHGVDGFLGRWREYLANNHGGNLLLRGRPPSDWVVSILEVAGSSRTAAEIGEMESIWKRKLRDRGLSLNAN